MICREQVRNCQLIPLQAAEALVHWGRPESNAIHCVSAILILHPLTACLCFDYLPLALESLVLTLELLASVTGCCIQLVDHQRQQRTSLQCRGMFNSTRGDSSLGCTLQQSRAHRLLGDSSNTLQHMLSSSIGLRHLIIKSQRHCVCRSIRRGQDSAPSVIE